MVTGSIGNAGRCRVVRRLAVGVLVLAFGLLPSGLTAAPRFCSPFDLQFNPDGTRLAVSDRTGGKLYILETASGQVLRTVRLNGEPTGVAWNSNTVFVAEYDAGTVAEVDADRGKVIRRLRVGPKPLGVALVPSRSLLLAADFGLDKVVAVNLADGREVGRIPVSRAPCFLAVTPDGTSAVVVNSLPVGDSTDYRQAASVSLLDLAKLERTAEIRLPSGAVNARCVAISADGRWAYVPHNLAHYTLPTTQLDRGWVNANGLTLIDLVGRECHATVLLDSVDDGAADPWGVAAAPDGAALWVTLSGVGELAELRLADLHALTSGAAPTNLLARVRAPSLWQEIARKPARRSDLQFDFAALWSARLLARHALPGQGARAVAVSADGRQLAIALYYSGEILLAPAGQPKAIRRLALGVQPPADAARRGEIGFHSGDLCFQRWLTCATCHPEGRADGLNWDLLNDGIGNPKNTKSLVISHLTPPVMSEGVRASMEVASEKGFHFIQFREVNAGTLDDVQAYIRSLTPEPSPWLVRGRLSAKARRGRAVFESRQTDCARCHQAPLFTNLKLYDVGTRSALDRVDDFDTPTCVELWRTAPYLHSGKAVTLSDLFTRFNTNDRHGVTSTLSPEDLAALVEYLLSL